MNKLLTLFFILFYLKSFSQNEILLAKLDNPQASIVEDTLGNLRYYDLVVKHGNDETAIGIGRSSIADKIWNPEDITLSSVQENGKLKQQILVVHPYCTDSAGIPFTTSMFDSYYYDIEKDKTFGERIILGSIKEDGIRAVCVQPGTNSAMCYLIFKTGEKSDSVVFDEELNMDDRLQSFSISAKKLSTSGRPDIIIQYSVSFSGHAVGGQYTKTQIWNLDSKKQLFDATNYSYSEWETPSDSGDENDEFICEYGYDIEFTHGSEFLIKNLKSTNENYDKCGPDHTEGTYKLVNSEYILTEEK